MAERKTTTKKAPAKTVAKKPVAKKPVAKKTTPVKKTVTPKETKTPRLTIKAKSAKELATKKGEPYVSILNVELDTDDIGNGAFELDWNDKFVANLVRAGYKGKTDQQIVDQWFQDVCRNVVLETYEQEMADPELRQPRSRKIDDNRTEFS